MESPIRIYADFNGLVRGVKDPGRIAVVLDTLGSVRDLANAGVILKEGLPLIAADASDDLEDLEGHGTAQYDPEKKWWVVEFDELGVRYVPACKGAEKAQFLCVSCRFPMPSLSPSVLFSAGASCPACGASLLLPIAPPQQFGT